jgi:hypothetical protein
MGAAAGGWEIMKEPRGKIGGADKSLGNAAKGFTRTTAAWAGTTAHSAIGTSKRVALIT